MKPAAEKSKQFDSENYDLNKVAVEGQHTEAETDNELLNINGSRYNKENYPVKSDLAIAKSKYLFTSILSDYEY